MHRKGLTTKILMSIGLPVAITFCVVAVISLYMVHQSVSVLSASELTAKSQAASNQVEGRFLEYMKTAEQMATNPKMEELFLKTTPGTPINSVDIYPEVKKALDNVKNTDPDNIIVSWVADVDSSQFTQSDGYTSGADYDITTRSWYKDLLEKKDVFISEPFQDAASGNTIVSIVAPVFKPGTDEIIGATCIDASIDKIKDMIVANKIGKTGFYIVATNKGQIFYHPNEKYINKTLADTKLSDNIIQAVAEKKEGTISYTSDGTKCHGYVATIGDTGWVIITGMPNAEFNSTYSKVQTTMLTIFILALLLIASLIILIVRRTVRPIKKLADAADRLALGDVEVDLETDGDNSQDEVGELTVAFGKMVDNIKNQAEAAKNIAAGDLSIEISARSDKDVLGHSMISVIETLRNLVKEADELTLAAVEGNLEKRGDSESFQGGYKEIIEGFNHTLDAVVEPLGVALTYIEKMANGDELEAIENTYKGEYGTLINNLTMVREALYILQEEAAKLTGATEQGNLSYRADVSKLKGGYGTIIEGINQALDSVIGPLMIATDYMEKIGKGEIPQPLRKPIMATLIKSRTASIPVLKDWAVLWKVT